MNGAWSGSEPSPGSLTSTILPLSLPFHLSKSRSRRSGATITVAVIVPFVDGVHATGIARIGSTRGVSMRTSIRSIHQPRPKSKPSVRTFLRPEARNCSCVHCSAARIGGEFVMRPPMRSVRYAAVCGSSLWFNASSMMRLTVALSTCAPLADANANARIART